MKKKATIKNFKTIIYYMLKIMTAEVNKDQSLETVTLFLTEINGGKESK